MIFIKVEQGSDEWKSLRLTKITATDCGTILGVNEYCTAEELWDLKQQIKPAVEVNAAMTRGSTLEDPARKIACERIGIEFSPAVVLHDVEQWMMASLDGLSSCHEYLLEIKCPGVSRHNGNLLGTIDPSYYAQMQHQLFCTGAKLCYFISYHPDHATPVAIHEVKPDGEYITKMVEKEREFYEVNLCQWKRPESIRPLKMRRN